MTHLEPGLYQRLAKRINRGVWTLLAHGIATKIDWVLACSSIIGNKVADREVDVARDASRMSEKARLYPLASNRARHICEKMIAAKWKWEGDKCSKHISSIFNRTMGTKRPVPMTSVKLVASRFYWFMSGHAPTGVYQTRIDHWVDDE